MERISDTPDFGAVTPLQKEELLELFGTDKPTREMLEANDDLFEPIERGQGIYIIVYKDEQPSEIFFAGYSYDCTLEERAYRKIKRRGRLAGLAFLCWLECG